MPSAAMERGLRGRAQLAGASRRWLLGELMFCQVLQRKGRADTGDDCTNHAPRREQPATCSSCCLGLSRILSMSGAQTRMAPQKSLALSGWVT